MRRKAFAILCVALGLTSFSSVGFSKELYAGLGEEVYNSITSWSINGERTVITACHPEEKSFTISRFYTWTHGTTISSARVKHGDSFVVFDTGKKPRTVKFVSFGENCTGRFEIPN